MEEASKAARILLKHTKVATTKAELAHRASKFEVRNL